MAVELARRMIETHSRQLIPRTCKIARIWHHRRRDLHHHHHRPSPLLPCSLSAPVARPPHSLAQTPLVPPARKLQRCTTAPPAAESARAIIVVSPDLPAPKYFPFPFHTHTPANCLLSSSLPPSCLSLLYCPPLQSIPPQHPSLPLPAHQLSPRLA